MRHFVIPRSAAGVYADGSATNKHGQGAIIFNASSANEINTWVNLVNSSGAGVVNPELFYTKQLLDTIRFDADEYSYYRIADEMPIQDKADKLVVRRWSPLRAHTETLTEGVPPETDRGYAKKYEMSANSYGRYMEFSDKVDFKCVDSVIAHYANEYAIVAIETLDLLAQEELLNSAQKWFAGSAATSMGELNIYAAKPQIADFRLIGMFLKRAFVKPRSNGRYHAIISPEFSYDMLDDKYVQSYMTINQSTYGFYDNAVLCPMFGFDFYEVNNCPESIAFDKVVGGQKKKYCRVFINDADAVAEAGAGGASLVSGWEFVAATADTPAYIYKDIEITAANATIAAGYDTKDYVGIKGSRRTYGEFDGHEQSYIPGHTDYDAGAWVAVDADADVKTGSTSTITSSGTKKFIDYTIYLMTAQNTIIVGKSALARTGLAGEGQAKMYIKALGSAGVLDPIDQRQSIGFKINSVGFCAGITPNAVVDYVNIPSQIAELNYFKR